MATIKNEVVSMEWDARHWLSAQRGKEFIAAVREYETTHGKVGVAFVQKYAYVMQDDQGLFNGTEVVGFLKQVRRNDGNLNELDQYCEVLPLGKLDIDLNQSALTAAGLAEHGTDIEERLQDLSGYWYEVVVDMVE